MDWLNSQGGINWSERELSDLFQIFFEIQTSCKLPGTALNFHKTYQLCYKLFSRFPLPLIEVTEHAIIRARRNDEGELFSHQYEISYNKQCPNLIRQGRWNRPLESIFYGCLPTLSEHSAFLATAISEACKSIFDDSNNEPEFIFTVGLWEIKPFMAICLCFDPKHLAVNYRMQRNIYEFKQAVVSNCNRLSSEFILECLSFFSNLSSTPSKDESNYIVLTAFFCAIKKIYDDEKLQVEGIIYPSASTKCKGLNIAMIPDAVDNYLHLTQVSMFKFERSKTNRKSFEGYPITDLVRPSNRVFRFPSIYDQRSTKELTEFQFDL